MILSMRSIRKLNFSNKVVFCKVWTTREADTSRVDRAANAPEVRSRYKYFPRPLIDFPCRLVITAWSFFFMRQSTRLVIPFIFNCDLFPWQTDVQLLVVTISHIVFGGLSICHFYSLLILMFIITHATTRYSNSGSHSLISTVYNSHAMPTWRFSHHTHALFKLFSCVWKIEAQVAAHSLNGWFSWHNKWPDYCAAHAPSLLAVWTWQNYKDRPQNQLSDYRACHRRGL